ncbi:MAG: hypothetical protein MZV64_35580 [Ignavibacteriales bacterium]|nr:hypothetical protein [Ignavibacteriales bacterium]
MVVTMTPSCGLFPVSNSHCNLFAREGAGNLRVWTFGQRSNLSGRS